MAVSHVVKCRRFCFIIDVSQVYAITTILTKQNPQKLTRAGECRLFCAGKNIADPSLDNGSDLTTRACHTTSSHKIQKKIRLDEKKEATGSPKHGKVKGKEKAKKKEKDEDEDSDSDNERCSEKGKDRDGFKAKGNGGGDTEVTVEYYRGLPQITVPLPSRKEKCRFTLRPVSNTVGDFLHMLCSEDRGIDHVTVSTPKGIRIASSNTIEALMEDDFRLIINDVCYHVKTPKQEKLSIEQIERLSDVKNLVHQLYEALNVEEHQIKKERELCERLEELKVELEPMEEKKLQLHNMAERQTNVLTWVGLGLMSVQFGILARLTWWEYSWDIMEPVTYFVTYGTAIAAYAYYVLTKQEYILPDVKDRQYLITMHKKAKKLGLDLEKYNKIKEQIYFIESDLKRLRDPLQVGFLRSKCNNPLQCPDIVKACIEDIMNVSRGIDGVWKTNEAYCKSRDRRKALKTLARLPSIQIFDRVQVHLPPHHLIDVHKKSPNPFAKAFAMFKPKTKEKKTPEKETTSTTTKEES